MSESSAQFLGLGGLRTVRDGKFPARSTVIGASAGMFACFNGEMMSLAASERLSLLYYVKGTN